MTITQNISRLLCLGLGAAALVACGGEDNTPTTKGGSDSASTGDSTGETNDPTNTTPPTSDTTPTTGEPTEGGSMSATEGEATETDPTVATTEATESATATDSTGMINPVCGNGEVEGAEECDDGNGEDGDFCKNDCTVNEGIDPGCPGIAIPLAVGQQSLQGDTSTGAPVLAGTCGGDEAPEYVFEVQPEEDGVLVVTLSGDGAYDPVLYAKAGSCEGGAELACTDLSFAGGVEELQIEAFAGESIWVVADGYSQTSGPFFIDFVLLGNAPGDTCPGVPVSIGAFDQIDLTGNTSSAEGDFQGEGLCAAGSDSPDIIYEVTPVDDGIINVALQADFDTMLYSLIECGVPSSQLDCSDAALAEGIETIQLPAFAGEPIWLVVDGYGGESGPYSLTMSLQPD